MNKKSLKLFLEKAPLYIYLLELENFIKETHEIYKKGYQESVSNPSKSTSLETKWKDKIGPYNLMTNHDKYGFAIVDDLISKPINTRVTSSLNKLIAEDINYINALLIAKQIDHNILLDYDEKIDTIFTTINTRISEINKDLSEKWPSLALGLSIIAPHSSNYQKFDFYAFKNHNIKFVSDVKISRKNDDEVRYSVLLSQFTFNNEVEISTLIDNIPNHLILTYDECIKDSKTYFKKMGNKYLRHFENMGIIRFIDSKRKIRLTLFGRIMRQLKSGSLQEFRLEDVDLSNECFTRIDRYLSENEKYNWLDSKLVFEYLRVYIDFINDISPCTNSDLRTAHKYAASKTKIIRLNK